MSNKRKERFQDYTSNSNAGGTSLNAAYSDNATLNSVVSSVSSGSTGSNQSASAYNYGSGGYNTGGYSSGSGGYNSGGYNSGGYNSGGYNSGGYNSGSYAGAYNSYSDGYNSYGSEPQGDTQSSGFGTIWSFLGIEDLSLKKKQCVYNCGIDLLGCMERCASPDCRKQDKVNKEQCRYGCMRKGITCSTTCMSDIQLNTSNNEANTQNFDSNFEQNFVYPTEQTGFTNNYDSYNSYNSYDSYNSYNMPATTQVSENSYANEGTDENNNTNTNNSTEPITPQEACKKHYDILPNEVVGVYSKLDTYSPYDMRVWPRDGKFGWTLSEINRMKRNGYDSPDVIEVNMNHSLYPILTDKPEVAFDYAN